MLILDSLNLLHCYFSTLKIIMFTCLKIGFTRNMSKESQSPKRKRRRCLPVREIVEAEEKKPEFRIIDGLRYVVPYKFILRTYAKKRWFERGILEVCIL